MFYQFNFLFEEILLFIFGFLLIENALQSNAKLNQV